MREKRQSGGAEQRKCMNPHELPWGQEWGGEGQGGEGGGGAIVQAWELAVESRSLGFCFFF